MKNGDFETGDMAPWYCTSAKCVISEGVMGKVTFNYTIRNNSKLWVKLRKLQNSSEFYDMQVT